MAPQFSRDAIHAQWHELSYDTWHVSSLVEQHYFEFYQIDFESQLADIIHHFGFIEVAEFNVAVHYFDNTKQTQGTMFVLHGYFDHVGLYRHLINFYLKKGFSVVAFDLPGHGLSSGEPAYIEHFSDYTLVLSKVIHHFVNRSAMPFSICGQSTGGAVILDYLLTQKKADNTFKNIILFAPLIRSAQWCKVKFLYACARLFFIKRIKRVFWNNSHDKTFLAFLQQEDPLQSKTVSVGWVGALMEWITAMKGYQQSNARFLIIQGKEDSTVDWRFNIPFIERLFPQAVVHYLNAARHHLVNESEELRKTIFDILDDWLDRQ